MDERVLREVLREELSKIHRILITPDVDAVENISIRLESLYGHLLRIYEQSLAPSVVNEEVLDIIRKLLNIISSTCEEFGVNSIVSDWQTPIVVSHQRGRPKYDLPRGQILFFIEHGFTCSRISSMLGISQSTLHRRMSEYGLSIRNTYSGISESELRDLISHAHESFPNAGYRFIQGWLNQRGLRIQECRIRQLMREVDPIGVVNRFFRSIHRRTYSVCGPQALWHLDGNHKLIR